MNLRNLWSGVKVGRGQRARRGASPALERLDGRLMLTGGLGWLGWRQPTGPKLVGRIQSFETPVTSNTGVYPMLNRNVSPGTPPGERLYELDTPPKAAQGSGGTTPMKVAVGATGKTLVPKIQEIQNPLLPPGWKPVELKQKPAPSPVVSGTPTPPKSTQNTPWKPVKIESGGIVSFPTPAPKSGAVYHG